MKDQKNVMNLKTKSTAITTTTTKKTTTTVFWITSAVLIAAIGISTISSAATPAQAQSVSNSHTHGSCNFGNRECLENSSQILNTPIGHDNINCNSKRNDNANEEDSCKINGRLKP